MIPNESAMDVCTRCPCVCCARCLVGRCTLIETRRHTWLSGVASFHVSAATGDIRPPSRRRLDGIGWSEALSFSVARRCRSVLPRHFLIDEWRRRVGSRVSWIVTDADEKFLLAPRHLPKTARNRLRTYRRQNVTAQTVVYCDCCLVSVNSLDRYVFAGSEISAFRCY